MGDSSRGHGQGHCSTSSVRGFFLGACVFFPLKIQPKTGEGLGRCYPSELGVTLENGCGPVAYTLTQDGSKALLLSSGSQ